MKIKELLNKKVNCSKLVKIDENGNYDVTNILLLGQAMGAGAVFVGTILGKMISNKFNK